MDENIRLEYCPLCGELVSHYECGCLSPDDIGDSNFIEPEGE